MPKSARKSHPVSKHGSEDKSENKSADTNARIERILAQKSVTGMMILTPESNPLRTNLDSATTMMYTRALRPITLQAERVVRDLDPCDGLTAIRVGTKTVEYLISIWEGYLIICLQGSSDGNPWSGCGIS